MFSVTQVVITSLLGSSVGEMALKHPNVQNMLQSNKKFDLVIVEQFHNEFYIGFAHRYNCPYIVLSTMGK